MVLSTKGYARSKNTIITLCIALLCFGCGDQSSGSGTENTYTDSQSVQSVSPEVTDTPPVVEVATNEPRISKENKTPESVITVTKEPQPTATPKPQPTATPTPQPTVQKYVTRLIDKINHVFSNGNIADSDWFKGASQEALLNPSFVSAEKAGSYFGDDDLVIGIDYNGVQKAYPRKYLEVYEVINDRFEDEALLVTY